MTCPIPGTEVSTSALRDNAPSAAKSRAVSASNVVVCRSIWVNRFLFCRLSSLWRSCFWRLSAAVRSFTSASRAVPSSSSTCRVREGASTGRNSSAAPSLATTHSSTASFLAAWPSACAKRRARIACMRESRSLVASDSSNARCHARGLVHYAADARADPRRQRFEPARVVGEMRGPHRRQLVRVQARLRDVNANRDCGYDPTCFPFSCACHASLDAHLSIQDGGKDGGDHTASRPRRKASLSTVRPPPSPALRSAGGGTIQSDQPVRFIGERIFPQTRRLSKIWQCRFSRPRRS